MSIFNLEGVFSERSVHEYEKGQSASKERYIFLQPQPFEASAIKFSSNVATEIVTHTDNNPANPFKYSKSHDGKCFEPVAAAERKK